MCLKLIKYSVFLTILTICVTGVNNTPSHAYRPEEFDEYFCENNTVIQSKFFAGLSSGYRVIINKQLEAATEIKVKLDSGATIIFGESVYSPSNDAKFTERDLISNIYGFVIRKDVPNFTFVVKGRHAPEHPPYILSLRIDGEENCINPNRTYFGNRRLDIDPFWSEAPDKFCGRRKINREHTELIVSGSASKGGNWPWHAAIYRIHRLSLQYICGGSLISKLLILTAAHCVTINEAPVNHESLGVVLGKTSLLTNEITSQERKVYQVIVHDDFKKKTLDNDIALLKLSAEVSFTNYVQPACVWLDAVYDQLDSYEITGTVVGWGIDQSDSLSNDLHEATIPTVPTLTCVLYDPVFYSNILNEKKFCAGNANGTAACNGDSGGGYVVFVSDTKDPSYKIDYQTGAWYVKGIVSVTLARKDSSICEPNAYTVYTDVAKYRDWILKYM
ncbi:CUB and peptidase domain-containing protein 2-like isoform X2 [Vanessa cardui]|uniref:CUB and peptidase domain-containing protein 2-like isoform X2 n=1 Tax=Vanessa cardui TaxID=171605 RepID=UPI001F13AECC|nr:CUB and peptidase domain-containing protein 2-like isoform X2 [Vanessa cardui]